MYRKEEDFCLKINIAIIEVTIKSNLVKKFIFLDLIILKKVS
tara:strand:+ start:588 stop:713 length:126 start_codon:yes stop_codon:yes gene_type:complete